MAGQFSKIQNKKIKNSHLNQEKVWKLKPQNYKYGFISKQTEFVCQQINLRSTSSGQMNKL